MTRIGDPKAGCQFTETPNGMMVSCTRRATRSTCAYCKSRPAEFTCDFPYRGAKSGKTCDGRLCVSCAYAAPGTGMHLCPQHRKLIEREVAEERETSAKVDAWLDAITKEETASQDAAVVCTCSTSPKWPHYGDPNCPEHKVDHAAVDALFPDWSRDLGDEPPVSELAGEIRRRGDSMTWDVVAVEREVDATDEKLQRIESHKFDGDTCTRCGVQGMPDGTVEGTCAEILQGQVNMYGCRRCPKCEGERRWPRASPPPETGTRGVIICDECGFETGATFVHLDEEFGLGYMVEAWLDDQFPEAQGAADELIARTGPVSKHDEAIVREFADDLGRRREEEKRIEFALVTALDAPGFAAELVKLANEHGCLPCSECGAKDRDVVSITVGGSRSVIRCRCGRVAPVMGTVDGEKRGTGIDVHLDPGDMRRIVDGTIAQHLAAGRRAGSSGEPMLSQKEIEDRLRAQLAAPGIASSPYATTPTKDPAVMDPAKAIDKVRHVKSARQTREHGCHWPGCGKQVPPAKWGCTAHWYMLPKVIRDRIWKAYRPGQEETLTPSREYVEAAREAQAWAAEWNAANKNTKDAPSWDDVVSRTRSRDQKRR